MSNVASPGFLTLPHRSSKPRATGVTHVLDKGTTVAAAHGILATAGRYVDLWKFGWGTAYLDPGLPAKLAALARAGIRACVGGTLLEVAWMQGKQEAFFDWAEEAGFPCVEVSRGVAPMSAGAKAELIGRATQRFLVVSEVGTKAPGAEQAAGQWYAEVAADLDAGAHWVVTEGRESGTVGVYRADGSVREDVVEAVLDAGGADRVIFEAPRKDQQAWFIRRVGPDVNLGNVALEEALGLETLRLGLRADTFEVSTPRVVT